MIVDKPAGFTLSMWWRCCGADPAEKIGHTGTLDPMATGVLPLLLGTAAKAESLLPDTDKAYEADFQLGVETIRRTAPGLSCASGSPASRGQVESALERFQGSLCSCPHVLAVRQNGRRLYELAREGKVVERPPRPVVIREAKLLAYDDRAGAQALPRLLQGHLCAFGDCGPRRGAGNLWHDDGAAAHAACGFTLEDAQPLERLRAEGAGYAAGCPLPLTGARRLPLR
ncbi:MAG: hypothetical protein ACLSB9_38660 [Hydrogeniiclostridium mannosilyticum]